MIRLRSLLAIMLAMGCSPAAAPPPPPQYVHLPEPPPRDSPATSAAPATSVRVVPEKERHPLLLVSASATTLDGEQMTDVTTLTKMSRDEALFNRLRSRREATPSNEAAPTEIWIELAGDAKPVAIASAIQTAALAGFVDAQLLVGHRWVRVPTNAGPEPSVMNLMLRADMIGGDVDLHWTGEAACDFVPTDARIPQNTLENTLSSCHGCFDYATVGINDDVPAASVAATLGALAEHGREGVARLAIFSPFRALPEGHVHVCGKPVPHPRDPADLRGLIVQRSGLLRRCYERALVRNPKLEGNLSVRIVIDESGHVLKTGDDKPRVDPKTATLPDAEVVACVLDKFGELEFPGESPGKTTITYPLNFVPKR